VRTGEVVQERRCGANEAARLAGAVARCVRAHLPVAFLGVIGRRSITAVSRVWAGDADAVHEVLHGVAPAVALCGDAADMAHAVPGGLQLVASPRQAEHTTCPSSHCVSRNTRYAYVYRIELNEKSTSPPA